MSISRHSNLRKPSLHSLRWVVRCKFVLQAHGTAAHGDCDPLPDDLPSSPFLRLRTFRHRICASDPCLLTLVSYG